MQIHGGNKPDCKVVKCELRKGSHLVNGLCQYEPCPYTHDVHAVKDSYNSINIFKHMLGQGRRR